MSKLNFHNTPSLQHHDDVNIWWSFTETGKLSHYLQHKLSLNTLMMWAATAKPTGMPFPWMVGSVVLMQSSNSMFMQLSTFALYHCQLLGHHLHHQIVPVHPTSKLIPAILNHSSMMGHIPTHTLCILILGPWPQFRTIRL